MENKYFKIGVIFAFLSVILGAFGAHLLKDLLSVTELSSFKTGVRYQMFHALGIIILSLNQDKFTDKLKTSLVLMCIGVLLFSFSIYFLTIDDLVSIYEIPWIYHSYWRSVSYHLMDYSTFQC